MLTITHSAAKGTMLEGTRKGDGAWEAIKAAQASCRIRGWRYFPSIRAIGIGHSRDKLPHTYMIELTATVLREAGFEVEVQVDATFRPTAEVEADKAAHMTERADALAARAERKGAESDATYARSKAISDMIPMGQPILVGHHSERRHRRDLDRMHNLDSKSWELQAEAKQAAQRAESSASHMAHREDPGVTLRRVGRLETERRGVQRTLDGYTRRSLDGQGRVVYEHTTKPASGAHLERLNLQAAHLDEQIAHWKNHLAELEAAGLWKPIVLKAIKPGDFIRGKFGWEKVKKVNRTTIVVERDPGWNDKVDVLDVVEHRPAGSDVNPVDIQG